MTTAAAMIVLAAVTVVAWSIVEAWSWLTGRKLITDVMRGAPRWIVGLIMLVVGALFGHFWL